MSSTTRKCVMAGVLLLLTTRGYSFEPDEHFKQLRDQMKAQINKMFSDDFRYYTISGKGINPEDLDININKGRVTIKTQKKTEEENNAKDQHSRSLSSFSFVQSFGIPRDLDESRVEIILVLLLPLSMNAKCLRVATTQDYYPFS